MLGVAVFSFLLMSNTWDAVEGLNYTLYEVTAFNARERAVLNVMHLRNDMIIFLNGVTNEAAIPMSVLVDGCCLQEFEQKLQDNDIEHVRFQNTDILKEINTPSNRLATYPSKPVTDISMGFYTWRSIREWIQKQKKLFSMLTEIVIGYTSQGKSITILKISREPKNMAVFLLGGNDGKDWLSPAVLLNFANGVLEKKWDLDCLLTYYDFYLLPILNPDGYEYSITMDRYWSKNRRIIYPPKICYGNKKAIGVNIDRNWFLNVSAQPDKTEECSSVFSGPSPLSETETFLLSHFLNQMALKMMAFIDLKGFDRLVTLPYGHMGEESANHAIMMELLTYVNEKLKSDQNATFFYGTTANYLYNLTGTSADWVKKNLNTPIVYTIYLKNEKHVLPVAQDIGLIAHQFASMVKETLMLANSIYGPLFSKQKGHSSNIVILLVNLIIGMR